MDHESAARPSPASLDPRFDEVWREDRGRMLGLARRILGDAPEAEDVVQEAFSRLARVDLDELEDVGGWLAVVVRRLSLDRVRSARFRHEAVTLGSLPDGVISLPSDLAADPADRITLDDRVQLALAVVLERLSPAERTSFVLHDIFGFPYAAIGEIVGRSTAACRQLASRARRAIREGTDGGRDDVRRADIENEQHRAVSERFIEACTGGDIRELIQVLDPDVVFRADLTATRMGVAVQPMSALMQSPITRAAVAELLPLEVYPQHAFRLGYAPPERRRSPRRPAAGFLRPAKKEFDT